MNNSIVILQFSPRNKGNCGTICAFLRDHYGPEKAAEFQIGSGVFGPCGHCDYECLKPGVQCPSLTDAEREILDTVCRAELVYFIVPNYCGWPCANYFAFNERTVGYFNGDRQRMRQYMDVKKRFIVISNSEGFEAAMRQQAEHPEILYLKSRAYGKQSIAGDLLDSQEARNDLLRFIAGAHPEESEIVPAENNGLS